MTLAIALLNEGATQSEIRRIAGHLRSAVPKNLPLLLIDAGVDETTSRLLANFAVSSHAQHIALSHERCNSDVARGIAQRVAGARHVLLMRPQDRLVATTLPRLDRWLADRNPDLALLAGGWWLTEPQPARPDDYSKSVLSYPDAARMAALPAAPDTRALLTLTPDPRRLLSAMDAPPNEIDPFSDPAAAWREWESVLSGSPASAVFLEPVLLRPLPQNGAAAALGAARARLLGASLITRSKQLTKLGPWIGDALALAPATEARATEAALQAFWSALSRRLRARAVVLPGTAGDVFSAMAQGQSLAAISLLATARQERVSRALAAEQGRLRTDLDLALPGTEYLTDLYARVRGL